MVLRRQGRSPAPPDRPRNAPVRPELRAEPSLGSTARKAAFQSHVSSKSGASGTVLARVTVECACHKPDPCARIVLAWWDNVGRRCPASKSARAQLPRTVVRLGPASGRAAPLHAHRAKLGVWNCKQGKKLSATDTLFVIRQEGREVQKASLQARPGQLKSQVQPVAAEHVACEPLILLEQRYRRDLTVQTKGKGVHKDAHNLELNTNRQAGIA